MRALSPTRAPDVLPVSGAVGRRGLCLGAAALAVVVGCGRRATEADCKLIVDKSVELQMKEMSETDPRTVEQREQEVRAALGDDIHSCERRRVTDKTISCVRSASSTKELDSCLR